MWNVINFFLYNICLWITAWRGELSVVDKQIFQVNESGRITKKKIQQKLKVQIPPENYTSTPKSQDKNVSELSLELACIGKIYKDKESNWLILC